MFESVNWAVIIPLANESGSFDEFVGHLKNALNIIQSGNVYFVVDNVSEDNTLVLCNELSKQDERFCTVWAPENKNIVDAYMRGYKEAYDQGHDIIIEMDAGMSHDPDVLPMFLRVLLEGNDCAFGSRFINGGSITDSHWYRYFLSKFGTHISNIFLSTNLNDMTSGYQGFQRHIVAKILSYNLISKGHFYQTELRFLLRKTMSREIPIHYRAPSVSVSSKSLVNSLWCLFYYIFHRSSKI